MFDDALIFHIALQLFIGSFYAMHRELMSQHCTCTRRETYVWNETP